MRARRLTESHSERLKGVDVRLRDAPYAYMISFRRKNFIEIDAVRILTSRGVVVRVRHAICNKVLERMFW